MSRSRREKNPELRCNATWPNGHEDTPAPGCPHICQLPVAGHGENHECCAAPGGSMPVS